MQELREEAKYHFLSIHLARMLESRVWMECVRMFDGMNKAMVKRAKLVCFLNAPR